MLSCVICCVVLAYVLSVFTRGACTHEESLNSGSFSPQNYNVSKCAIVRMLSPRLEGVLGATHAPRSMMNIPRFAPDLKIIRLQHSKNKEHAEGSRVHTRGERNAQCDACGNHASAHHSAFLLRRYLRYTHVRMA